MFCWMVRGILAGESPVVHDRAPLTQALWGVLLLFLLLPVSNADTERVIDYEYDAAGNLIEIASGTNSAAPTLSGISPGSLRIGPETKVTAHGSDLFDAEISGNDPGLMIRDIVSDGTTVDFTLQALEGTAHGEHTLSFTTRLGSATAQIIIHPKLPKLVVSPSPLVVSEKGTPLPIRITLSSVDIFAHRVTLSIPDPEVATASVGEIHFTPGAMSPDEENITVQGVAAGVSSLDIQSDTLEDARTGLFVTPPYSASQGLHEVHSMPLGVVLEPEVLPSLLTRGPFVSQLSVFKEAGEAPGMTQIMPLTSPPLGVAFKHAVTGLAPAMLQRGQKTGLNISGVGLSGVVAVAVIPDDGISVQNLAVSPDGNSVTVEVDVANGAALGMRQLRFGTDNGELEVTSDAARRIFIVEAGPRISSMTPIVMMRTEVAYLVIRGAHFQYTDAVSISPVEGLTLGSFEVNQAGTEIIIGVVVAENAPLGRRVVTVITGAGRSADTIASTLHIVNGPVEPIRSLVAPRVGVVFGEPSPLIQHYSLNTPPLGVVMGGALTGLRRHPAQQERRSP